MILNLVKNLVAWWQVRQQHRAIMKALRKKCVALETERCRAMDNLDQARLEWLREAARSRKLEAKMKQVLRNHPARGRWPQGA